MEDKLISRVNKFLDSHTFNLDNPFMYKFYPIHVKAKLTGLKNMIKIGELTPTLTYELYIVPSGDKVTDEIYTKILQDERVIDRPTDGYGMYPRLVMNFNTMLEDFLEFWGMNYPVFCEKLVNLYAKQEQMNENLIVEGKLDSVVRKLTADIIKFLKFGQSGEFSLPEDISGEDMTYSFPQLDTEFSIDLNIIEDDTISGYELNADYYRGEDTIEVNIRKYPNSGRDILQDLIGDLNETLTHELTHMVQYERGFEFPEDDPKKPFDYYTQEHELEAQFNGFMRRAKAEKRSLESVMDEWFKKNEKYHRLKPKKVEKLKKLISRMAN